MTEFLETGRSFAEQPIGDYVRTFARLLDPNIPPATRVVVNDGDTAAWPLGQTVAFATICATLLWGLVFGIIYIFA